MSEVPLYEEVVRACASFLLCEGRGGGVRAKENEQNRERKRENAGDRMSLSTSS